MRRPLVLLLLPSLLLAGCASSGHEGHGTGTAILFGVQNGTNETVEVGWTVSALAANETVVWTRTETLEAGAPVERIEPLETTGEHRVDLSWGAGHAQSFTFDMTSCRGTYHLVVALAPDGTASETTRECHE